MLSWLRRRREQAERIEAEADALIGDLGNGAYSEARRRAREASSDEMEREWAGRSGDRTQDRETRRGRHGDPDGDGRRLLGSRRWDRASERAARSHRPDRRVHADRLRGPGPASLPDSVRRGRDRTRNVGPEGDWPARLRPVRSGPGGFPPPLADSRDRLPAEERNGAEWSPFGHWMFEFFERLLHDRLLTLRARGTAT